MYSFSNSYIVYLYKYTIIFYSLDKYWFVYYYVYMFKYLIRRRTQLSVLIYCKDHRRRPIRFGFPLLFRDTQGDIPVGWCNVCGSEVFCQGEDRCVRCRQGKENLHE